MQKLKIESEWRIIEEFEDLEICVDNIRKILMGFEKKQDDEFIFDITFGTKPMSAAVAVVAVSMSGDIISYVTGKNRDTSGKVIPGSERLNTFSTIGLRVKESVLKSIDFFNKHIYGAAEEILKSHRELIDNRLPERRYLETILLLTEFQMAREDFLFDIAAQKLRGLLRYIDEFHNLTNMKCKVEDNIEEYAKKFDDMSNNPFSKYRLGELINTANRSANTKKYNDAVARLYRALEFIGQLKLKENNLIDENLVPLCRVENNELIKDDDNNKKPIGLVEIYRCLYFLGIKVANKIIDIEKNQPNLILSKRNKSILAHGFLAIKNEDYEEMKRLVEEVASEMGYSTKPLIYDLILRPPF